MNFETAKSQFENNIDSFIRGQSIPLLNTIKGRLQFFIFIRKTSDNKAEIIIQVTPEDKMNLRTNYYFKNFATYSVYGCSWEINNCEKALNNWVDSTRQQIINSFSKLGYVDTNQKSKTEERKEWRLAKRLA